MRRARTLRSFSDSGDRRPRGHSSRQLVNSETGRSNEGFLTRCLRHCNGELVGGLYGVALGGAFFGESMFSFVTDASKVALVHLVARLRLGRFRLLDTQFVTTHLRQFGAREIPRGLYKAQLADALRAASRWLADPDPEALTAEIRALAGKPPVTEPIPARPCISG